MALLDLNVDLGELPDEPAALYGIATVVNVACGGHAGDLGSMARALSFAMARGTRVAAHPSYPDREGFGRASMDITPEALEASIAEQCDKLQGLARKLGYPVAIVKPHGALYHDAAKSPALAAAVLDGAARGLGSKGAALTVVGPPKGALLEESLRRGHVYAREGFADRGYRPDGSLVPRAEPGALLTDPNAAARQATELAARGGLETLCVHSDTPGAVAIATAVRDALHQAKTLVGSM